MTKEDIKQICQIYDNFRSERDAATIAYNSDDTFWEHILATYNLSQPSLPSNLDEAAEKWKEEHFRREYYQIPKDAMSRSFKAGAEWMAGQGITVGGTFHHSCGYPSVIELNTYLRDYEGKEVIVQIRKKQ